MVGNVWYGRAGLREAGIRGEDALHWIEGLHEVRLGREKLTQLWLKKLPPLGQAGIYQLPSKELDAFLATLNDHRLRRAAEFDLGRGIWRSVPWRGQKGIKGSLWWRFIF